MVQFFFFTKTFFSSNFIILFFFSGYPGISVKRIISLVIEAVKPFAILKFDFHRLKMADSLLLEDVTSPRKREYSTMIISLYSNSLKAFSPILLIQLFAFNCYILKLFINIKQNFFFYVHIYMKYYSCNYLN